MAEPVFKITAKVAFFEHVCGVKGCQCNEDPFVVAFKNKWLVELQIKHPRSDLNEDPVISGPFDSKDQAEAAMEDIKKNLQMQLKQQGLRVEERPNLRIVH